MRPLTFIGKPSHCPKKGYILWAERMEAVSGGESGHCDRLQSKSQTTNLVGG